MLHVLKILLEHDRKIITVNYYISNNYLEKRKHLVKAAHNIRDVIHNIQNLNGVPPKLRRHLEDMMLKYSERILGFGIGHAVPS